MFDILLNILQWTGMLLGLWIVSALWGLLNLIFGLTAWEIVTDFFSKDPEEDEEVDEYR